MARLTVPEKILVAAAEKWPTAERQFTAEELVVACWGRFPDTFGLQGYVEQYPDSNRVLSNIMGNKGLKQKGWIKALGDKRYVLTRLGLEAALAAGVFSDESALRGEIDRTESRAVRRLVTSSAFAKFNAEAEHDLLFRDACAFWGINPRSTNEQLVERLGETDEAIRRAETETAEGSELAIARGRIIVTRADVASLRALHNLLQQRFDHDLSYIRARTTKYGQLRTAR